MKKIICLALCLICVFNLSACLNSKKKGKASEEKEQHTHAFSPATCLVPATCNCGATEGTPIPHTFAPATCLVPATCTLCGTTQGQVTAHAFSAATCLAPATCTLCGTTQGEVLAHSLNEKNVCKVCGTAVSTNTPPYVSSFPAGTAVYKGPGESYGVAQFLATKGAFTITEESRDSSGNIWGKLKSGIGWVLIAGNVTAPVRPASVYASTISLSAVGSNHKFFSVNNSAYAAVVSFSIDRSVTNVRFSSATNPAETPVNHFTLASLPANTPLSVQLELYDFSEMYLYFDENGVSRYFSIHVSGMDGSLVVTELAR